jgi:hypothetical protein
VRTTTGDLHSFRVHRRTVLAPEASRFDLEFRGIFSGSLFARRANGLSSFRVSFHARRRVRRFRGLPQSRPDAAGEFSLEGVNDALARKEGESLPPVA